MKSRSSQSKRGTTLVEVLIAVALMTFIFIFITAELIATSQAENLASNHSQTIAASNQLLGVIKGDGSFWATGDWAAGPLFGTEKDGCGKNYPGYTDTITSPSWHPLCGITFPELNGAAVVAQYMWNAQIQGGDPNIAQLTLWVMTDEGGRNDIYELHGTRMKTAPAPSYSAVLPVQSSPPPSTAPPSVPSIPPTSPTPKPSPTSKPSPSPKPSPTPTGIFE